MRATNCEAVAKSGGLGIDLIEPALFPNRPIIPEQIQFVTVQELKPLRQTFEQAAVLRKAHCPRPFSLQ